MLKICGCQVVWATNGQLVPEWQARRDWRRLLGKGVARSTKDQQTIQTRYLPPFGQSFAYYRKTTRWKFPISVLVGKCKEVGSGSMWAQARAWYSNSWPARMGSQLQPATAGGGQRQPHSPRASRRCPLSPGERELFNELQNVDTNMAGSVLKVPILPGGVL